MEERIGTNIGFPIACGKTNRSGYPLFTTETGSIPTEANSIGSLSLYALTGPSGHFSTVLLFFSLRFILCSYSSSPPPIFFFFFKKSDSSNRVCTFHFPTLFFVLQFSFFSSLSLSFLRLIY